METPFALLLICGAVLLGIVAAVSWRTGRIITQPKFERMNFTRDGNPKMFKIWLAGYCLTAAASLAFAVCILRGYR